MKKSIIFLLLILLIFPIVTNFFSLGEKGTSFDDTPNIATDDNQSIDTENNPYKNLTYLAIGDSITYGCCTAHPTQYDNGGYPTLVANTLGLKSVKNAGVPGNQVDAMISRIPSMTSNAQIISFMGGICDFNVNTPLGDINDSDTSTFYGRLNVLSEKLLEKYPDSFIFYMTPFPSGREKYSTPNFEGYTLEDFADAVIAVAEKYDFPVFDIYRNGKFETEMYDSDSDGIHPSEKFFESYTAPMIVEFIKENYK